MSRPLRVAHFAVDENWIFLTDEAFPVVAQLDRRTGNLEKVVWWEVAGPYRNRAASNAVLVHGGDLWVSSPCAGGVIRIDIASAQLSQISLEEASGPLAAVGDAIWVVADANWDERDDDDPPSPDATRRPVVWAGPFGPSPHHDDEDLDFSWDAPRPLWRIHDGEAERVDLGGDASQLAPISSDEFLVVLRRPDDPVVKTWDGGGSTGYSYPGVLAKCDSMGAATVLTGLPDTGGSLIVDGDRCWLSGFELEVHEDVAFRSSMFAADPNPLHEIDVESGRLTVSPLTVGPAAIVGDVAVTISDQNASPFGGTSLRSDASCYDLTMLGEPTRVELPRIVEHYFGDVVVSLGTVWLASENADALVWIDPHQGTAGDIAINVDLGPNAPAPIRPVGVDLDQFEYAQLARLRDTFVGGWVDEAGKLAPFIDGVDIGTVELRGAFPDSHIVATFRADDRPEIAFARRWNLYDELGNAEDLEYADMHLMEDIESGGLPSVEECVPDAEGIVWF